MSQRARTKPRRGARKAKKVTSRTPLVGGTSRKNARANMAAQGDAGEGLAARHKKGDGLARPSKAVARPTDDLPATRATNPEMEQDEDHGHDEFQGRESPVPRSAG